MATVLVIGAGASGLTATVALVADGFQVTCVDTQSEVGGCWVEAFDFVKVQSSAEHYRPPNMRYADSLQGRPGKHGVLDLWRRYVKEHDIIPYIQLSTRVTHLRRTGELKWEASLRGPDGVDKVHRFDFIVIATGVYGGRRLARTPEIPGRDEFPGIVSHASEMSSDWRPYSGERIVVVGAGSTALAYAEAAGALAERKEDVHLVVRTPRWTVPTTIAGFVPHCEILYNRIDAMFLPAWSHQDPIERVLHSWPFKWLIWAFWAFVEMLVFWSCRWPKALLPRRGKLLYEMRNAIPALPEKLFDLCHSRHVVPHGGVTISKLSSNGSVHLSNGTVISEVNRVIFGTGYKNDEFEWMEESLRQEIITANARQLYRHIVAPGVPRLAFVGFASGLFGFVTEHLQAQWVCAWFKEEIQLPNDEEMRADMAKVMAWKSENVEREAAVPYAINVRCFQYHDEILQDMGIRFRRRSVFSSLFSTWNPDDYATVRNERIVAVRRRK